MRIGICAALASLAVGCNGKGPLGELFEQEDNFSNVDENSDGSLAREEFAQWARDTDLFEGWHTNAAPGFDATEVASGVYRLWGGGEDGITAAEWGANMAAWFPDVEPGDFDSWDLDKNGTLNETEIINGFNESNVLGGWKTNSDGRYDEDVVIDHIYALFDTDADGKVNEYEWTRMLDHLGI